MINKRARQRAADLRWDWTAGGHPDDYCAGYPFTEENIARMRANLGDAYAESYIKRDQPLEEGLKHKYHTDGHATKEEAERCHYEYQVDHRQPRTYSSAHPCRECRTWTPNAVEMGSYMGTIVFLCPEHQGEEFVRKHYPFHPDIEEWVS